MVEVGQVKGGLSTAQAPLFPRHRRWQDKRRPVLRLLLPPNLPAAAARDAIPVKVEFDSGATPPQGLWPLLAALQRLCGGAQPPPFLQLRRAQLRDLIQAAAGQAVFFSLTPPQTAFLWLGPTLRGVSEHLKEEAPPPPAPTAKPISVPRSLGIAGPRASTVRPLAGPRPDRRPVEESTPFTVDGSEQFLAVSLPSRESLAYSAILDLVKSHGFVLEPSNRKWWLRDRHKVLNFLAQHRSRLETEFRAVFTENFQRNTRQLESAEVACDVTEAADGFTVTLGLRAGRVSADKLHAAAAANRAYVEEDGRVYLLPPQHLEALGRAQRAFAGHPGAHAAPSRTHRVSFARLAEAEDILAEIAPHFQPPDAWRRRSEALRNLSKLAPAPLPTAFAARLRPYQALGVAWLFHLHRHELGGILADEMGLGKTLQAMGLLLAARQEEDHRPARPSLVVCPASLVENWLRECARFAPDLRVVRHHGAQRWAPGTPADVIVTSYGTLVRDRELLGEQDFLCLIADEAQHVKNRRTQNFQALRTQHAQARLFLTGTPVENSVDDLRTLFDVLMPGFLEPVPAGTRREDRQWLDERLRARTAPYLLRRTKVAVAPELPAKIEQVIYCEMSAAQAKLYRETQEATERALVDLEASGASENALRLATLTQLLRLRQVCCDPRLLPGMAETVESDSAKLEVFRELLEEAIDDGHRLLVFSQFTRLLDLIGEDLTRREIAFARLDGSLTAKARQAEVDRFQTSPDLPVFLISLKAGGTGLNLTAADTVVHFDPWWNPAVEAQATDRAHRIGQTRIVTSYKFICSGTVEEKVLQLQETKRALLADVFEASDAAAAKLSLDDLKSLLR